MCVVEFCRWANSVLKQYILHGAILVPLAYGILSQKVL